MRLLLLIGIAALHLASFSAAKSDDIVRFVDDDQIDPILKANYSSHPRLRNYALDLVTRSANIFSGKFVKEVGKIIPGNFISCPISASMILSMITYGTRGETERQLRKVLQLPSSLYYAKIGFQAFVDSFADYKQVELRLANRIFLPFGFYPKREFMEMAIRAFRSDAPVLDFHNSAGSSRIINEWCEKATNHRIKNIISPDDLKSGTGLVLVNAVYFKGEWMKKFDPQLTSKLNFHVNDDVQKMVSTMYTQDSYRYGKLSKFGARFVELPYASEDSRHKISMFIILPVENSSLAVLEEKFDQINVSELISLGENRTVRLLLPKFKIETEISLEKPLQGMGLTSLFENPNFQGIVDFPPLQITKIIQKAFIEINEVGSEAAGITATDIVNKDGYIDPRIVRFYAIRPFMGIIARTSNKPVKIFSFRYTGPDNNE